MSTLSLGGESERHAGVCGRSEEHMLDGLLIDRWIGA
jgi:hypothetical protein